jgi:hypothetical protein
MCSVKPRAAVQEEKKKGSSVNTRKKTEKKDLRREHLSCGSLSPSSDMCGSKQMWRRSGEDDKGGRRERRKDGKAKTKKDKKETNNSSLGEARMETRQCRARGVILSMGNEGVKKPRDRPSCCFSSCIYLLAISAYVESGGVVMKDSKRELYSPTPSALMRGGNASTPPYTFNL